MNCDWPTLCTKFTCLEPGSTPTGEGECFSAADGSDASILGHNISTDYIANLAGVQIPIMDTKRIFSASASLNVTAPTPTKVYMAEGGTFWCFDVGSTGRSYKVKEDCTIIASTLHYLDLRYGVCLYRQNTETVKFDVSTSSTNTFKDPWQTESVGSIKLYGGAKRNWTCLCKEEWFLVKDGIKRLIATSQYQPLTGMDEFAKDHGSLFDPQYTGIPDLELIIDLMPVSSSDAIPWDDELRYHGHYSYRGNPEFDDNFVKADGGCRDYFYPAWCRGLQKDPLWESAAASRYMLSWDANTLPAINSTFAPSAITVDPLPVGSFVKHPKVGEVWQFLVAKRAGGYALDTSPVIDEMVLASLAKNNVSPQQGTMLYYPIGVY